MIDAVALSQALIRCPSVTPKDEGAIAIVESALTALGFTCKRMRLQAPGSEAVVSSHQARGFDLEPTEVHEIAESVKELFTVTNVPRNL